MMFAPATLTPEERVARLRLARSDGVGPATWRRLIARFGSAATAMEHLPELSRRGGRDRPLQPCALSTIEAEIVEVGRLGARHLILGEIGYPDLLAAIEDAPPALVIRGPLNGSERRVAIVGARNASANGRRFAEALARDLAGVGLTIVSGLARGIDAAAHNGALSAGPAGGGTIAVVAGGVDVVYPRENAALTDSIAKSGLIVSEMPPGLQPRDIHVPRRNRIIAGLSLAVVVVEAAIRSGSLITARLALEQGREVMAVPGSPLDPRCRGANRLIRDGALLIEEAAHVIEGLDALPRPLGAPELDLSVFDQSIESMEYSDIDRVRLEILDLLGPSPVSVDELLRQCQSSPPVIGQALLELDLAGRLERHPGNRVSLIVSG
jgi:DNA processing protein